jgi:two-component system, HptB-dependent secretion and biofilm response regulator
MCALPLPIKANIKAPEVDDIIKALIVDDSNIDRLILQKLLQNNGYDVCAVSSGHKAQEIFDKYHPDIVFMDLNLPGTNGYEVTKELKHLSKGKYVPVIFVTAETDDKALEQCLESGGDDFIVKPIKESLLKAKIGSFLRIKKMHDDTLLEKEAILKYSNSQAKDMHDANKIIHNIREPLFYNPGNIKYSLEAQYIISGDMLCSAVSPSGKHIVMVGDNTGHGLPAAIGSLIIYEVFYTMVRKGFEIEIIIEEINQKLFRLLPSDRFFAATLIEFGREYEMIRVWNAGMPEVIVTHPNGSIMEKVSSLHMPLGIKTLHKDDIEPVKIIINNSNRIYAYSDGITEMFNDQGKQFGEERVARALRIKNADERFDHVMDKAGKFRNGFAKMDDVLFVEINCDKSAVNIDEKIEVKQDELSPMNWSLNLDLQADTLRHTNPVPVILQSISGLQGLQNHREKLFLILSEMYSNSVEHGILGLESSIKEEENGFIKYYELRQSGLEKINDASLSISIDHHVENDNGVVSIVMENSGKGFDYSNIESGLMSDDKKSGRGIALLIDLCRKYEYSNGGRSLKIEYEWECPSDSNNKLN